MKSFCRDAGRRLLRLLLLAVALAPLGVSADPDSGYDAQIRLARAAIASGQLDEAGIILRSIADAPEAPVAQRLPAMNLLAGLAARQGHLEDARQRLEQALALDAAYDVAWENLGDIQAALAARAYAKAERTRSAPRLAEKLMLIRTVIGSPEQGMLAALEKWRAAWQSRNAEAYLINYAQDFRPANNMSREAWREQRTRRLSSARSVQVTLEGMQLDLSPEGDRATARFIEHLVADDYRHVRKKTLDWTLTHNGGWRIVREIVE